MGKVKYLYTILLTFGLACCFRTAYRFGGVRHSPPYGWDTRTARATRHAPSTTHCARRSSPRIALRAALHRAPRTTRHTAPRATRVAKQCFGQRRLGALLAVNNHALTHFFRRLIPGGKGKSAVSRARAEEEDEEDEREKTTTTTTTTTTTKTKTKTKKKKRRTKR